MSHFVDLLDALPSDWTKATVGKYCDVQLGKMLQSEPSSEGDELKPYLRTINIGRKGVDLSHELGMWIKRSEMQKFRLNKEDVLVSEGGDAGRVAMFHADGDYFFQNAINRVRPLPEGRMLPKYIYYWLSNLKDSGYVEMICNVATIPHFTAEKLKASPLAFPSFETQLRIARFLDEKTARVDALIEKKHALLERLAEKRQALITRSVTKGLNPDVPMRPSGVEWLGETPEHWQVVALNKLTTKITNGYVGPTREIFLEEGVRYIQSLHIKNNQIVFKEDYFVAEEWSNGHAKSILAEGDVLIVQTGDIGQVAHVSSDFAGCNCHALIICTPEPGKLVGEYLSWLLCSDYGQQFLQLVKTGALHPHLNCGNVKFFFVLVPPVTEQHEICALIRAEIDQIETCVRAVERSTVQLSSYRSSLITAAVTGQLADLNG